MRLNRGPLKPAQPAQQRGLGHLGRLDSSWPKKPARPGSLYVVFVAEGTFCDFAKFRRLAFYGPTEFIASRWARHAV
jgi:hypothetical protein